MPTIETLITLHNNIIIRETKSDGINKPHIQNNNDYYLTRILTHYLIITLSDSDILLLSHYCQTAAVLTHNLEKKKAEEERFGSRSKVSSLSHSTSCVLI